MLVAAICDACHQPLFQRRNFRGRRIAAQHDLPPCLVQGVERVEELLLRAIAL